MAAQTGMATQALHLYLSQDPKGSQKKSSEASVQKIQVYYCLTPTSHSDFTSIFFQKDASFCHKCEFSELLKPRKAL